MAFEPSNENNSELCQNLDSVFWVQNFDGMNHTGQFTFHLCKKKNVNKNR
jgi:hypothetical protein